MVYHRNSWLMVTFSLYDIVVIRMETTTQKNPSNQVNSHSQQPTTITNKIILDIMLRVFKKKKRSLLNNNGLMTVG